MAELDFDQLEQEGYAIVKGFMDQKMTSRVRQHMDSLLPPVGAPKEEPRKSVCTLRHPIPGSIMAELLNNKALLKLASTCLQSQKLRLLEQVLIRSELRPPPHGPLGWHVDWAFFPRHYEAIPRQTYFHMVHCLNTVPPGGAAFMIVPESHHLTYAATRKMNTAEELNQFKRNVVEIAGIDLNNGIEICPDEGDLLVFNPMALHSGSANATDQPRYVHFASFFDASATDLWGELRKSKYRDGFPDSLRENLPQYLLPLLEW